MLTMGGTSQGSFGDLLLQPVFFWVGIEVALLAAWVGARRFATGRRERLLRLLRLILIPYIALISGGVSPYWMGLSGINWQIALSLGSILIASSLLLWLFVRSILLTADSTEGDLPGHRPEASLGERAFVFFEGGAREFNWCFWRAIVTELFHSFASGVTLPVYWGGVVSILCLLPEIWLSESNTIQRLISVVVLIVTSVLFFYTRNFWLCWVANVLLHLIGVYDRATTIRA